MSDVAAGKKKKKGGTKTVTVEKAGGPIPDAINFDTGGNGGGYRRGELISRINVNKDGKIKDLNVGVRIQHADTNNLVVWLEAPSGIRILLFAYDSNDNGAPANTTDYGSGPNTCAGTPTTFDDQALLFINDTKSATDLPPNPANGAEALAPYAGSFKPPERALAEVGTKMKGIWTLRVEDQDALDPGEVIETGALGCFRLTFLAKLKEESKKGGKKQ